MSTARENGKALPKIKFVKGKLDFNWICSGCGERVNKATSEYCHECEGGHDIHITHQAQSKLHRRTGDEMAKEFKNARRMSYECLYQ